MDTLGAPQKTKRHTLLWFISPISLWFMGFISNYLLLVYKLNKHHGGGAPLGGELPTFIVFVGENFTLVISMGFLWGHTAHSKNWGELTHQHDSWVVHHQVSIGSSYDL